MSKRKRKPLPNVTVRHNPEMVDAVREMHEDRYSVPGSLVDRELPAAVADKILRAVNGMEGAEDQDMGYVDSLVNKHPGVALEGLAKLGKVLSIPRDSRGPALPLHFDPLEIKARVVEDLCKGRVEAVGHDPLIGVTFDDEKATLRHVIPEAIPVNVQAVFNRWMAAGKGNSLYDMQLAPPWYNALLVYNNDNGNVWAMHMVASDIQNEAFWSDPDREDVQWQPVYPADHYIEWDRVRWIISVQVYIGGQWRDHPGTEVRRTPTLGPLMIWRIAVYEDGTAADVHWTQISEKVSTYKFNNALGVLTETLNMCNCVNVHVAVPKRKMQRAQRRRMERHGVTFSEVHIRPASKSYKHDGVPLSDMEVPLHGVIGHYAHYGQDGKGLLFGKLAGRFWIPPHVRGSREAGEVIQSYVTESPVVSTAPDLAPGTTEQE